MFDKRINYSKGIIDPKIIDKNPYEVFLKWIKEAINSNLIEEPNAMNIAINRPRNIELKLTSIVIIEDISNSSPHP